MVNGTTLGLAFEDYPFRRRSVFSIVEKCSMSTLSQNVFALVSLFLSLVMMPLDSAAQMLEPKPPCFPGADDCGAASPPVPSTGATKWHPGHYIQLLRGSKVQSDRFNIYSANQNNSDVEGFVAWYRWPQIEASQGDYSAGIALIQAELDYLARLNTTKRLIIAFKNKDYGGACPSSDHFPAYVQSAGLTVTINNSCNLRMWDATAQGYYIAMLKALGDAFDSHPLVEALVLTQESAHGFGKTTPPAGFSAADAEIQFQRTITEVKPSWPTTNVTFSVNWEPFAPSGAMARTFAILANTPGMMFGSPDSWPAPQGGLGPPGDQAMKGETANGFSDGTDYRGVIGSMPGVEASTLGGDFLTPPVGGYTINEVFDNMHNTLGGSHLRWDYNIPAYDYGSKDSDPAVGQGIAAMRTLWSTTPVTNTACPTAYKTGCDGS